MVRTWEREGWRTLKDLLIFYNKQDVGPFVEAVLKLRRPYLNDKLDIFKNSFSVSDAARLKMLKEMEPDSFFRLFPKKHADLYQALQSQLTGGLSIVFSRLVIAGKTKIRPHQIKDPETCQICLGVNANALYLFAIHQENPAEYFVRYKESENIKPDTCSRYGLAAYKWLSWISHKENKFIHLKFNKGEKTLADQSIPIDSFIKETNEVRSLMVVFFIPVIYAP